MRTPLMLAIGFLACAQSLAADFDWSKMFKEGLVDANGKPVATSSLKGKVVAVYFSAHWCGPCKIFTPKLVEFVKKNAAKMAVVFVSCDHSKGEMASYMKEAGMPWAAVPYKSASGEAIWAQNGITSIPTLLVYSKDGKLITKNGRDLAGLQGILDK